MIFCKFKNHVLDQIIVIPTKMLKSKVFVKKTRRGKVVKITREHYLRDDIWCGSSGCDQCTNDEKPTLSENPAPFSSLCEFPHYVILDTNAVLHQVNFAVLFVMLFF